MEIQGRSPRISRPSLPAGVQAPERVDSGPALDRAALSSKALERQGRGPDRLSGSFIQPFGGGSPEYWLRTLSDMQRLGMDTAVIQFSRYGNQDLSANTERILEAADQLGMTVMVGTMLNEHAGGMLGSWYLRQYLPWELKREAAAVAADTAELVARFSHHPSFGGIYIPYEVNATASAERIGDFYGAIAKAAKEAKPDLKVMLSPYTNLIPGLAASRSPEALSNWWDTVLARADIDILAWQDGVGGTKWYQGFAAEPASIETVKRQIEATRPHVSKLINFDFNDYMSPQGSAAAAAFYEDYRRYLAERDTE
jgi:hypothetical protein